MTDKTIILERLMRLRARMKRHEIDACLVITGDDHNSEYTGEFYKVREYLTGFTGSNGTLVVFEDTAYMWTDGRYFLQAEEQLEGTGIELMRQGEKDVPTVSSFLSEKLKAGDLLAFDGKIVTKKMADLIKGKLESGVLIDDSFDPAKHVWLDRPMRSREAVWVIPEEIAGNTVAEKVEQIRKDMREKGADYYLISSLADICWLLNIRGGDIEYTPVVLSFLIVTQVEVRLYIQIEAVDSSIKEYFLENGVVVCEYDRILKDLSRLKGYSIYLDPASTPVAMTSAASQSVIIEGEELTSLYKAVKNKNEREGMRLANISDSVVMTKFIYWLKNSVGKEHITELDAVRKLRELRECEDGYLFDSFASIVAYANHGAIVHYEPTEDSNYELLPEGMLLCDTGAHYTTGTTDMTRTVALGPVTDEMRHHYTLVLKGHLNLLNVIFPEGSNGGCLDILARQEMWREGLDFRHGTGHGVGHLLCVHEGPQRISHGVSGGLEVPLKRGMVISDEPGLYIDGQYGIRTESLVVVRKAFDSEYGKFFRLEAMTAVPFDMDLIATEELSDIDKERINRYHSYVWDTIGMYLDGDEKQWLFNITREVQ